MAQAETIELGTIKYGREIDQKRVTGLYIRARCGECGLEWWAEYRKRTKPGIRRICKPCNIRQLAAISRAKNNPTSEPRPRKTTPVKTDTCIHFWDIETAAGLTSVGVCRNCGKKRVFKNTISYDFRGEELPERGGLF